MTARDERNKSRAAQLLVRQVGEGVHTKVKALEQSVTRRTKS